MSETRNEVRREEWESPEEMHRQILLHTGYLMGLLDLEGTTLYVNKTAFDMINGRPEDIIGRPFWDTPWWAHSTVEQAKLRAAVARAREGDNVMFETTHPTAEGDIRWVEFMIHPIRGDDGALRYLLPESRDITERKLAEIEMREARQMAELASRVKSELLANTSHELRTPLNSIIGFADILLGNNGRIPPETCHEYLKVISNSATHLLRLINDILDVSAIEAGKIVLHEEEIIMSDAIFSAVRLVLPRAAAKKIAIVPEFEPDLPPLWADETRVKQILLNLLTNAVKFTDPGGRILVVANVDTDGGLSVGVIDTGIGMDAEGISRALKPFEQLDVAPNRVNQGTGLGLPLAVSLTELHNGTLEIESTLGAGTRVTARFPASRVNMMSNEAGSPPP